MRAWKVVGSHGISWLMPRNNQKHKSLAELWPLGLNEISAEELRALSDLEFAELRRRLHERAREAHGSDRAACQIARRLVRRRKGKHHDLSPEVHPGQGRIRS